MLHALVLICSLATTPDLRDCDARNAVDVIRDAEPLAMPSMCVVRGMAVLAATSLRPGPGEAAKFLCERGKS